MNEPIKAGDRCVVLQGLGRKASPNVGLTVTVRKLMGEHSQHGRIWRCDGEGVCQLKDNGTYDRVGWADFPAAWLTKLPPDTAPPATSARNLEVTQ